MQAGWPQGSLRRDAVFFPTLAPGSEWQRASEFCRVAQRTYFPPSVRRCILGHGFIAISLFGVSRGGATRRRKAIFQPFLCAALEPRPSAHVLKIGPVFSPFPVCAGASRQRRHFVPVAAWLTFESTSQPGRLNFRWCVAALAGRQPRKSFPPS